MMRARWLAAIAPLLSVPLVVALLATSTTPAWGASGCLTGSWRETDAAAIADLRVAIAASCPCSRFDGSKDRARGAYMRCVREVVEAGVASGALRPQCRSQVRRLESVSVCGRKPEANAAPCVRRASNGKVSCAIKAPGDRCVGNGKQTKHPCFGFTHCIDAADTNGDLLLDDRDSGLCNPAPSPTPHPTPTPQPTAPGPQPFPTGSGGAQLAQLVNQYRVAHGKAPVPVTPTMMAVAGAHVHDLAQNPNLPTPPCNLHSWSSSSMWSGCCYDDSHSQASCMWNKPGEISSALGYVRYTGNGFELAYRGWYATPQMVLDFMTSSPAHRAVLLNQQTWAKYDPFPAMGAAMKGEFAVIWFGSKPDPQH